MAMAMATTTATATASRAEDDGLVKHVAVTQIRHQTAHAPFVGLVQVRFSSLMPPK